MFNYIKKLWGMARSMGTGTINPRLPKNLSKTKTRKTRVFFEF